MSYELTGKVKVVQDAQTFGSGFTKREFVVTVEDGKYPQEIILECVQDKVSLLDSLTVGQEVTVTFDIRGREHNSRWFNNLVAWKVSGGEVDQHNQDKANGYQPQNNNNPAETDEYGDDIPF